MGASREPRARLAELVAALSLGIDLGFGQPMEHVLRQCLIALRLAEGIGLDEQERATLARAAGQRWLEDGRRVRIALPPTPGTDFADVLAGRVHARVSNAAT